MTAKVSICLPDLRGGGAERVNLDLAHAFVARGLEVEFALLRATGDFLQEAREIATIHDLGGARMRSVPGALARYLRNARPDCLLAAMWPLTVMAPVARVLSRQKTRVVVSEHGILSAQYKSWGRAHSVALRASTALGYRMSDAVVAVSSGGADDMATLSGLSRERIQVIHNPVPAHRPASPEALAEAEALWACPAGARILSVGRFKAVKNHPLLLEAFAQIPDTQARLMLVGTGENEAELRTLAERLGVASRVIFAGFQADPAAFYESADLFVLSSNNEGFGNVIVEALGAGVPVVSTRCPSGPEEILDHGRFGLLTPVGDVAALRDAMMQGLEAPVDREVLRGRAADFSVERAAQAYLTAMDLNA